MPSKVDFCGDRLRLSAFLRVVGDGMPQRPTRFRRHLRDNGSSPECLNHRDTDYSCAQTIPAQESVHIGPSNDSCIFHTTRSSSPEQSMLTSNVRLSLATTHNDNEDELWRPEDAQPTHTQQPATQQTPVAGVTKSPGKPHKAPSTQKRRRLPVNELALLQIMSSDDLPKPNEADRACPTPVSAIDPIEDGQVMSNAPFSRKLPERPVVHRVQKPTPTKDANAAARIPRLRPDHLHATNRSRALNSIPSFAMCSDGFVGAELSVQSTKRIPRPRINTTNRRGLNVLDRGGLNLAHGFLPAPPLEPCEVALIMENQRTHTEDRMSNQVSSRMEETQLFSQHIVLADGNSSQNQPEEQARNQLPDSTTPIRPIPNELNEGPMCRMEPIVISSNSSFDAHGSPWSPHTPSLGSARVPVENKRFEGTMQVISQATRTDHVN
ncbi:hypothetical protein OPT61_g1741 [Boeremia exigua]|uniref:Uncharacterized protein n=1 Tax=Boeremia exigua TaxID=749465 RepID=A0ACC2INZ8_9PLEO|nr:hypothetical protein OPT61_g1741 [Boeremia exigua]